ncbi:hypothetical protein FQ775_06380 [Nitratireductor mangrovi]|uniref:Uncharacterized protein n=1 Tax=Nitratireductor mangrovi TaxID=2599600 RepID=A0A5B8KWE0_9HYPH|nr:hypothetical protein [Nitratireductor mangrovi]QDZ00037.1 hypothetical protein FQ775_06380 [Nitratireductor mangrovi]
MLTILLLLAVLLSFVVVFVVRVHRQTKKYGIPLDCGKAIEYANRILDAARPGVGIVASNTLLSNSIRIIYRGDDRFEVESSHADDSRLQQILNGLDHPFKSDGRHYLVSKATSRAVVREFCEKEADTKNSIRAGFVVE